MLNKEKLCNRDILNCAVALNITVSLYVDLQIIIIFKVGYNFKQKKKHTKYFKKFEMRFNFHSLVLRRQRM